MPTVTAIDDNLALTSRATCGRRRVTNVSVTVAPYHMNLEVLDSSLEALLERTSFSPTYTSSIGNLVLS